MTFCFCRKRVLVWLLLIIALLVCTGLQPAVGQNSRVAVCRVYNQVSGQQNIGSGTLINRSNDGSRGLVLTCAHLFSEGAGEIVVDFPGGKSHGAKLVGIDRQADLAAVAIANPSAMSVSIDTEVAQASLLSACGYGSNGQYRCATGAIVGQASAPGQTSLMIDESVQSGDSGGGVFDERGKLVAVVWGESEGVTYASYGRPLRQFLDRMIGRPSSNVINCPNGLCPLPRQPTRPERNRQPLTDDSRWSQMQAQINRLQKEKQDRGDYVQRAELVGLVREDEVQRIETEQNERHASMLDRFRAIGQAGGAGQVAGKAAVGFLGLSGPAGWGVLAATTLGGWWLGSRMKRRSSGAGGRRRRWFPG